SDLEMREAIAQAEGIMRSRRHLRPRQDKNFVLDTSEGVQRFWAGISGILVTVIPGIVIVSLVIGGIVIMNIMLMAVAERTREIGLRKSLGARRADVLRQFLAESTAIATVGATFGIVAGILLTFVINALSPLPPSVPPSPSSSSTRVPGRTSTSRAIASPPFKSAAGTPTGRRSKVGGLSRAVRSHTSRMPRTRTSRSSTPSWPRTFSGSAIR